LVYDVRERRIPNKVTLTGAALGLLINGCLFGGSGLLESLKGFGAGIGLLLLPFMLGAMGGGDVKMLGMVGALKGVSFVIGVVLYTALAGGVIALVLLLKDGEFLHTMKRIGWLFRSWFSMVLSGLGVAELQLPEQKAMKSFSMPYGVAIFVGVLAALLWW